MEESRKRTILKGLSWRVFSTIQSFFVTYFLTGDFHNTIKLMIILNITGFFVFYIHERLWIKKIRQPKPAGKKFGTDETCTCVCHKMHEVNHAFPCCHTSREFLNTIILTDEDYEKLKEKK